MLDLAASRLTLLLHLNLCVMFIYRDDGGRLLVINQKFLVLLHQCRATSSLHRCLSLEHIDLSVFIVHTKPLSCRAS